jgi:hypothetical protein
MMQASPINIEPYLPILFLALCIVMMVFICYLISLISGWFALSERFRLQSEPCGETKCAGPFFYTVYMRFWGHYSSIIRITAAEDALYLSVILPFRIGHPPLRIPWKEIQFGRTKLLWRRYVVLTLGNQEKIPMRISERMARKLGILERIPN